MALIIIFILQIACKYIFLVIIWASWINLRAIKIWRVAARRATRDFDILRAL